MTKDVLSCLKEAIESMDEEEREMYNQEEYDRIRKYRKMCLREYNLSEAGHQLSKPQKTVGNYLPYVRVGNLLYLSGTICSIDGEMAYCGKIGKEQSLESAYKAAQTAAVNSMGLIKRALGSMDLVKRFIFVTGYVNALDDFKESSKVLDGASDLLVKVYGDAGKHARSVAVVSNLPKDSMVMIQCILEIDTELEKNTQLCAD